MQVRPGAGERGARRALGEAALALAPRVERELVAYVADYLSYEQDAVATEAYLGTARRRVSIRRHATLLDYAMHDGCNARVFVHVRAKGNAPVTLPAGSPLLTELPGRTAVVDSVAFERALDERPEVFEVQFTAGGFGWVVVYLEGIEADELAELVFEAWRLSAPDELIAQVPDLAR